MEAKLITAVRVREILGGVTDMTIWRWLHDPQSQFPKPLYIAKRRYWRESELIAWIDARCPAAAE